MDISDVEKIKEFTAKFNQETSTEFSTDDEINDLYLRCQQNYANNLLDSRGHVFLNEVFDMLGLQRTPEGQIVGWHADNSSFVDFGLFDTKPEGLEDQLKFNVDGIIWDKI